MKDPETKARELFNQADTNGNGTLDPEEFKQFIKSFNERTECSEEEKEIMRDFGFGMFDVDGDGNISLEEVLAYLRTIIGSVVPGNVHNEPVPNQS